VLPYFAPKWAGGGFDSRSGCWQQWPRCAMVQAGQMAVRLSPRCIGF
jgi:hypothetical protein